MLKQIFSTVLSTAMIASSATAILPQNNAMAETTSSSPRIVEYLDRGLVAVRVDGGVYLSWRLLGTEETTTTFDIYRDGEEIVSNLDATNYTDNSGFDTNTYKVVVSGKSADDEKETSVWNTNYLDIPISKPEPDPTDTKVGTDYSYRANDASVADLDGDGEYEIILKWDPSNSQDNMYAGYTGKVYIDAYKLDGTQLWRIDLGKNVRAGAHYTQFIVYDFDSDGKAELAVKTAPGTKDSKGNYVSSKAADITDVKGNTEAFVTGDDTKDYRADDGRPKTNPDWLTMFNGETGEAMQTVNYHLQRGNLSGSSDGTGWGGTSTDSQSNYADRHLAGVAYLDGVHPSLITTRGYYFKASMGAYNWDGKNFTLLWKREDKKRRDDDGNYTMYGQGSHSLSVADVDNDGYDEVIFGSAVVDNDGSILNSTGHGHGDALHVSDFNNDGEQEVFKTAESQPAKWGAELRKAKDGTTIASVGHTDDVGRGVMGNIIASNPGSEFWSAANNNLYSDTGKVIITTKPNECNFLSWWDGDLTREILDQTRIVKYELNDGTLSSNRLETFVGVHSNNGTKATPSVSADILGDWREEVIFPTLDDTALRIYTTTIPTEHKLTTFMHDTQYRCAIAWQNVGYNQPPHPSFYVGDDKTDYPKPNVKTAVDSVTIETPTPEQSTETIMSTETFDNADMSE